MRGKYVCTCGLEPLVDFGPHASWALDPDPGCPIHGEDPDADLESVDVTRDERLILPEAQRPVIHTVPVPEAHGLPALDA